MKSLLLSYILVHNNLKKQIEEGKLSDNIYSVTSQLILRHQSTGHNFEIMKQFKIKKHNAKLYMLLGTNTTRYWYMTSLTIGFTSLPFYATIQRFAFQISCFLSSTPYFPINPIHLLCSLNETSYTIHIISALICFVK